MTKEDLFAQVGELAKDYSCNIYHLMSAMQPLGKEHRQYVAGVLDGTDNAIIPAFIAGAKAMLKLIKKNDGDTTLF